MSEEDEVRVTVSADAADYTPAMNAATEATNKLANAAQNLSKQLTGGTGGDIGYKQFAALLASVGDNTKKLTSDMIAMGAAASATESKMAGLENEVAGAAKALEGAEQSIEGATKVLDNEVPAAAEKTKVALGSATREVVVLGREFMVGDFSRIPGTLFALAERAGGLMTKMGELAMEMSAAEIAGVAAILGLAAAFGELVYAARQAQQATMAAMNAASQQGRDPEEARRNVNAAGQAMRETGYIGMVAAQQMASAIDQMGEKTDEQKAKMREMAEVFYRLSGGDTKKAIEELNKAFGSTAGLDDYMKKTGDLVTLKQQLAYSQATDSGKLDIGLDAALERNRSITAEYIKQNDAQTRNSQLAQQSIEAPGAAVFGEAMSGDLAKGSPDAQAYQPGTKALSPEQVEQNKAIEDGLENEKKLIELTTQLGLAQEGLERLRKTGSQAEQDAAAVSIRNIETKINAWKAVGEASWTASQQEIVAGKVAERAAQGGDPRQLLEDESRIRIDYYRKEQTVAGLSAAQIVSLKRMEHEAVTQLAAEEARDAEKYTQQVSQAAIKAGEAAMVAADKAGAGKTAAMERSTRAEMEVYLKASQDMTRVGTAADTERAAFAAQASRLHMTLMKEDMGAAAAAAKQELADWLAMMHEKENAAHDDFAKVEAIQQQIVDRLRSMGAAETKSLETELSRQDSLRREHASKMLSLAEQTETKQRQIDSSDIAFKRAQLDEEVALQRMSKSQELAILTTYAAQKHAAELKAMTDTLAGLDKEKQAHAALYAAINISNSAGMTELQGTLNQQTIQWQDYYNKIRALQQQWLTEDMKANEQGLADKKAKWEAATAPISSAIDSQVGAVLRGNETIGMGVRKMLGDIVIGYAQMGVKKLMQLASDRALELVMASSTETAKTGIATTGAAARAGISATETATQNAGVLARIARWIFGESAQTAATATGTATRSGIENSSMIGQFFAWIGKKIAGWLGMETAQTGATTAGNAARTTSDTMAATTSMIAQKTFALGQVTNEAIVAGAAAFADSAMLGPVGLAAAPAAATAASGSVMAMSGGLALETGAWNLPANMPASLHAGEMVIPANFASGIRSILGKGGGGGDNNLTYAPHVSSGSSSELTSLMRSQAASMKSFMWHATRNGALAVPGRG